MVASSNKYDKVSQPSVRAETRELPCHLADIFGGRTRLIVDID